MQLAGVHESRSRGDKFGDEDVLGLEQQCRVEMTPYVYRTWQIGAAHGENCSSPLRNRGLNVRNTAHGRIAIPAAAKRQWRRILVSPPILRQT
jgi:hypothetical protein